MGYWAWGFASNMTITPSLVAQTAPVEAGTYFLSSSELLAMVPGDTVICFTTSVNIGQFGHNSGGGTNYGGGYQQSSTTDVYTVEDGDAFQLFCYSLQGGSDANFAYLTATLIGSVTAPPGKSAKKTQPPPQR